MIQSSNKPTIARDNQKSFEDWYKETGHKLDVHVYNDCLYFELEPKESKTTSGLLYIPEASKDAVRIGIVRYAPKGWMVNAGWFDCPLKIGDRCVLGVLTSSSQELDGFWLQQVRFNAIFMKIGSVSDPRNA